MNLTPIEPELVSAALAAVAVRLEPGTVSAQALQRIAATAEDLGAPQDTPAHRQAAIDLICAAGMRAIDEAPATAFSWDGQAVRTRSEASVLIHEVAHWLIAPVERRTLPDFGLGAGPKTGRIAEADAARCVDDAVKEEEELLASLLGILFEAALGQPAIHAFMNRTGWRRGIGQRRRISSGTPRTRFTGAA